MTENLPKIMIICLVCTIIIELSLSLILGVRKKKDIVNIVLVNLLTNPLVVVIPFIVYLKYGLFYRKIILIIFEVFTLISEGYIYKKYLKYKKINCYILSLILNCSSYFIGLIINKFIW